MRSFSACFLRACVFPYSHTHTLYTLSTSTQSFRFLTGRELENSNSIPYSFLSFQQQLTRMKSQDIFKSQVNKTFLETLEHEEGIDHDIVHIASLMHTYVKHEDDDDEK
ncbi:unnamed protein product [Orchesella dallaii]|uniref:Uncharacterized protein n=1 Tax=Orchesella dallaii TaxID=48710 RepID=A0ABP1QR56_9HEXA